MQMQSLRAKIILLTCLTVVSSAAVIGAFSYIRTVRNTLDIAVEGLSGEARLMALRFKNVHDQMKSDLLMVSVSPSFQAVVQRRLSNTGNIDHRPQTDRREALASLFTALLETRPYYTQARLIGLKDNGRELVRVERQGDVIIRTPKENLQEKHAEPYFQEATAHLDHGRNTSAHHGHKVSFSDVTYNRENGKVSLPRIVTIRAVLPVFDEYHHPFGLIVMNADYEKLLSHAFTGVIRNDSVFVVNNAGDYLKYETDGTISGLEFHDAYTIPPPAVVDTILNSEAGEDSFIDDQNISYFVRVNVNEDEPDETLSVMLQVPRDMLMSGALAIRRDGMMLTIALLLVTLGATSVLSRRLMAPLEQLTDKVTKSKEDNARLELPVGTADEVGKLARAFQALTDSHVENESKLRSVISNIGEGIVMIDETGIIDSFNPACGRIFGYAPEEVIGKNISMLMPAPHREKHDAYLKRYDSSGEKKIAWEGRREIGLRRDGSEFPAELTVTELVLDGRRRFIGILRDITEQEAVDRAKTEFISIVSHELRTPLTSIKGALGLLRGGALKDKPGKTQEVLDIAYKNSERLRRLIDDILDMERIGSGKMDIAPEPMDLALLVRASIQANKGYAAEHGVSFVRSGAHEPVLVNGDGDRLMQVMANLLSNAAKFSEKGGEIRISLSQDPQKGTVRVSVKDNGCGIPEAAQATIFDRFTQADSSSQRKKGGSGLGLGIAKKIVELHGGTIGFVTQENRGTTFFFELEMLADAKTKPLDVYSCD